MIVRRLYQYSSRELVARARARQASHEHSERPCSWCREESSSLELYDRWVLKLVWEVKHRGRLSGHTILQVVSPRVFEAFSFHHWPNQELHDTSSVFGRIWGSVAGPFLIGDCNVSGGKKLGSRELETVVDVGTYCTQIKPFRLTRSRHCNSDLLRGFWFDWKKRLQSCSDEPASIVRKWVR